MRSGGDEIIKVRGQVHIIEVRGDEIIEVRGDEIIEVRGGRYN